MNNPVEIMVIGASAGGLNTLAWLFENIQKPFPVPILVTKHVGYGDEKGMAAFISKFSQLPVEIAMDKQSVESGRVYLAPADYHMQIEEKGIISLSLDERINFARPAIDVLFQSAASAYGSSLMALILSGANSDGVNGLGIVQQKGGITVAQDPKTAEIAVMPKAAIQAGYADYVIGLKELPEFFRSLSFRKS